MRQCSSTDSSINYVSDADLLIDLANGDWLQPRVWQLALGWTLCLALAQVMQGAQAHGLWQVLAQVVGPWRAWELSFGGESLWLSSMTPTVREYTQTFKA